MYGSDILCGISKGTFEIRHKISYPYIERCYFYTTLKFQELLDLRAHKCFWNAPQITTQKRLHPTTMASISRKASDYHFTLPRLFDKKHNYRAPWNIEWYDIRYALATTLATKMFGSVYFSK